MAIVSCIDLQVCPLSCGQLVYHFGIEIQKTRIPSKIHHQILQLPVIHQKTEHRSVHRERGVPPRISTLAHHCCCSIPTHTHTMYFYSKISSLLSWTNVTQLVAWIVG